jgi:hypothetical protein
MRNRKSCGARGPNHVRFVRAKNGSTLRDSGGIAWNDKFSTLIAYHGCSYLEKSPQGDGALCAANSKQTYCKCISMDELVCCMCYNGHLISR